jgi:hypothetical protein
VQVKVSNGFALIQNINQFWTLVGALIGEALYSLPYSDRLPRMISSGCFGSVRVGNSRVQ